MAAPDTVVNLGAKFDALDKHWTPRTVATFNDLQVRVVKVRGEFVWHAHQDTDEVFLVRSGHLTIELRDLEPVTLGPEDVFVVPRRLEHRPVADDECEVLLIEPGDVVNTGDAPPGALTAEPGWL